VTQIAVFYSLLPLPSLFKYCARRGGRKGVVQGGRRRGKGGQMFILRMLCPCLLEPICIFGTGREGEGGKHHERGEGKGGGAAL